MATQPLYRAVQERLLERIKTMRVGDVLPPEPELEREYGVSRITVRRAVENLVQEGLLEKRQGFGTLVREPEATLDIGRIYSWTNEMRRSGLETSSTVLGLTLREPSRYIADALRLGPNEKVVVLSRLRHIKSVPTALMVNYLRERYVPGLVERGLQRDSLYDDLIDHYGLDLVAGDEVIRARLATRIEASLLDVDEGSAILDVGRTTFLRGHIPFEVVEMAARGDKYQYRAQLTGGTGERTRAN